MNRCILPVFVRNAKTILSYTYSTAISVPLQRMTLRLTPHSNATSGGGYPNRPWFPCISEQRSALDMLSVVEAATFAKLSSGTCGWMHCISEQCYVAGRLSVICRISNVRCIKQRDMSSGKSCMHSREAISQCSSLTRIHAGILDLYSKPGDIRRYK